MEWSLYVFYKFKLKKILDINIRVLIKVREGSNCVIYNFYQPKTLWEGNVLADICLQGCGCPM